MQKEEESRNKKNKEEKKKIKKLKKVTSKPGKKWPNPVQGFLLPFNLPVEQKSAIVLRNKLLHNFNNIASTYPFQYNPLLLLQQQYHLPCYNYISYSYNKTWLYYSSINPSNYISNKSIIKYDHNEH